MSELDFIVYGIILTITLIRTTEFVIGIRKMENRYSRVNDKLFFADTNTELIDLPLSCFNVVTI